ncbi:MAG: 6-phosphogluconolactonase [Candidatus Dechloromonas phosphoritropha]
MKIEVLADAAAAAQRAADVIAADARTGVAERGRFVMAVSGGSTPWLMLRAFADMSLPWSDVQIMQVDERVAPAGSNERNLTHIETSLLAHAPLNYDQLHPMPVDADDLDAAAAAYAKAVHALAGTPPIFDLVHLGLGSDGHTASLIPGDPVLDSTGAVALASPYHGCWRMTLTYPTLLRARRILWLVTGAEKAAMLARLVAGDNSIPAGRLPQENALLIADAAAAAGLSQLQGLPHI